MHRDNNHTVERGRAASIISFIFRLIWLVSLAIGSWAITNWIIYEARLMHLEMIYRGGISRDVPENLIVVGISILVFLIINFLAWIGYFVAVPSGRRRSNRASIYSRNPQLYR